MAWNRAWLRRLLRGGDPRLTEEPPHSDAVGGGDDRWIALPRLDVAGAPWSSELWEDQPVHAPRHVDVGAFLEQRPLPYVWPNDPAYVEYVTSQSTSPGEADSTWLYVFLHHPDRDVVIDALRQPQLGSTVLNLVTLADLVMAHPDPGVRKESVLAAWRLDDDGVRRVVGVLREETHLPRTARASYAHGAVDRLLAAHPAERSALAAELGG